MPISAADAFPNELLIHARKQQGWSQMDLAEKLDPVPDKGTVSRWHLGKTKPGPYNRAQLARVLGRNERQLGYPQHNGDVPFWEVNYNQNTIFTGRDNILSQLAEVHRLRNQRYKEKQNQREKRAGEDFDEEEDDIPPERYLPQALVGLGGIGKTQIAIEYAYRYKHEYHTIFLLNASNPLSLAADFTALAGKDQLDLSEQKMDDQAKIIKAVQEWFASSLLTRWLLIFDNVDSPETLKTILHTLLPQNGYYGHVILTTRMQDVDPGVQKIEVATMPPEEGAMLLLRRAGIIQSNDPLSVASDVVREQALELSRRFSGLPLALEQAGAYLRASEVSVAGYIKRYERERAAVLQYQEKYSAYPASVATTWSLSFEKVRQANPVAVELLTLFAFLAPDTIPEEMIVEGSSNLGPVLNTLAGTLTPLDSALTELLTYSLVQRHPETNTCSIHQLVQAVIQDSMSIEEQRVWAERVLDIVHKAFVYTLTKQARKEPRSKQERYLPQTLACLHLLRTVDMPASAKEANLLTVLAQYFIDTSQVFQAEDFARQAVAMEESRWETEDPYLARTINVLAEVCYVKGQFDEAIQYYERSLRLLKTEQGIWNEEYLDDVVNCLQGIGNSHFFQRRIAEAERRFQEALAFAQEHTSINPLLLLMARKNIGMIYTAQGKYREAEVVYKETITAAEEILPHDDALLSTLYASLASLYVLQKETIGEAKILAQKASAIASKYGSERLEMANTLQALGLLYFKEGNFIEAESSLRQALAIYRVALGNEHAIVASVVAMLGGLYLRHYKISNESPLLKKAIMFLRRALLMEEKTLEGDDGHVARIFANLGLCYSLAAKQLPHRFSLRVRYQLGHRYMILRFQYRLRAARYYSQAGKLFRKNALKQITANWLARKQKRR